MALCEKYLITHSHYLEVWTPEDRAKAMAYLIESSARCQLCGTAPWEWEENRFAYEPRAVRCHGCYLKDTSTESSKNLPGTTVTLVHSSQISAEQREQWARGAG